MERARIVSVEKSEKFETAEDFASREQAELLRSRQPHQGGKPPRILFVAGLALTVCVAGVLVAGILPRLATERELTAESEHQKHAIKKVALVTIKAPPPEQTLVLPATLQAIQEIPIFARCDGYLAERYVDIGDRVKANQVLARIDAPEVDKQLDQAKADFMQAQALVKSSEADLARAKASVATSQATVKRLQASFVFSKQQLKRYNELATEGAISRELRDEKQRDQDADLASIDAAKADVAANQAQVVSLEEKIAVNKAAVQGSKAALGRVMTLVGFKKVTAPCDGVITARNADPGSLVTLGSNSNVKELLRMARTDVLRVMVNVPQSFYRNIAVGSKAELEFAELPGQKILGKVARIAVGLDVASRTMLVEVHVDNRSDLLKPGMYATVRFIANPGSVAEQKAGARLRIPATALIVKPEGLFVARVDQAHKVHFSKVTLGRDFGKQIEIMSGVSQGDQLVLDPEIDLKEGDVLGDVTQAADEHAEKG